MAQPLTPGGKSPSNSQTLTGCLGSSQYFSNDFNLISHLKERRLIRLNPDLGSRL